MLLDCFLSPRSQYGRTHSNLMRLYPRSIKFHLNPKGLLARAGPGRHPGPRRGPDPPGALNLRPVGRAWWACGGRGWKVGWLGRWVVGYLRGGRVNGWVSGWLPVGWSCECRHISIRTGAEAEARRGASYTTPHPTHFQKETIIGPAPPQFLLSPKPSSGIARVVILARSKARLTGGSLRTSRDPGSHAREAGKFELTVHYTKVDLPAPPGRRPRVQGRVREALREDRERSPVKRAFFSLGNRHYPSL